MKTEHSVCGACSIRPTCHPALNPERYNKHFQAKDIPSSDRMSDEFLTLSTVICRHFTCDGNGATAARNQFNLFDRDADEYTIVDVEGFKHSIQARPFHSIDKPYNTRVIDREGNIYSEQDGTFYPTGQIVTNNT